MKFGDFVKVKSLASPAGFKDNLARLGLNMPCDEALESGPEAVMAQPLQVGPFTIGNRFAVHPMEGWDGHADGRPSDNTRRRWRHFGLSGAKMIWGGEAAAVRHDELRLDLAPRPVERELLQHPLDAGAVGVADELLEVNADRGHTSGHRFAGLP